MVCNFSPDAFSVFGFSVHWYALAYIFGLLTALQVTLKLAEKFNMPFSKELLNDYIAYAIIGIVIGGRLGHVLFYDLDFYLTHPKDILKIWKGGMSFFGGFLGVISITYAFCKIKKIDFLQFMDLWSVSVPIGLFFGRIANFINGELLGKPFGGAWRVIFADGVSRHPSQLYEAFLEGIVLFGIMLFYAFKKDIPNYKIKGFLCSIFCEGYGGLRLFAEFFREPDSEFSRQLFDAVQMNLNQFIALALMFTGVLLKVIVMAKHVKKKPAGDTRS